MVEITVKTLKSEHKARFNELEYTKLKKAAYYIEEALRLQKEVTDQHIHDKKWYDMYMCTHGIVFAQMRREDQIVTTKYLDN